MLEVRLQLAIHLHAEARSFCSELSICMLEVRLQLAIYLRAGGPSRRIITQPAGFQILLLLIRRLYIAVGLVAVIQSGTWIGADDGRAEVAFCYRADDVNRRCCLCDGDLGAI